MIAKLTTVRAARAWHSGRKALISSLVDIDSVLVLELNGREVFESHAFAFAASL